MRIVIALGGNALLRRGDPMTTEIQRRNIRTAAEAIASIGSAVALVIFTMITAAHLRVRAETGANLLMLVLAIVAAGAVFVTFVFTTLIHEPASVAMLAGILVLSVALDYGWKHFRGTRRKNVRLAH